MITGLIVGIGMLATVSDAVPSAETLKVYASAKASAGPDAESQVKLALWCEAHGLGSERLKHLALAVLKEPRNAKARALMGLIAFGGRWEHPEAVSRKVESDAEMARNLAEYNGRRAKTPYTAEAHWRLALWCEEKGLKPEALAHLTTVVRLDPKREGAWKRLGYRREKGRWVTEAQLSAARAEVEAQKQATSHWRKQLETLSVRLGNAGTKIEAQKALSEVTDPRAVPAIWTTFIASRKPKPALAAQLFGQIDSPLASRALVYLGLYSASSDVRRVVSETLKRRDLCEFVGIPIASIRNPIKYEVKRVGGPGSPGTLLVEGQKFDVKRQYTPASLPDLQPTQGDSITYDASGLPVLNRVVGFQDIMLRDYVNFIGPSIPSEASIRKDLRHFQNQFAHTGASKEARAIGQYFMNHPPDAATWMGIQDPLLGYVVDVASNNKSGAPFALADNLMLRTTQTAQIPIGQMAVEAQKSAVVAERQLENDVAMLEQTNTEITKANKNALELLKGSTGQDFGPDRKAWDKWFSDVQGYAYKSNESDSRPTVFEEITPAVQPVPITFSSQTVGIRTHSCFAAGTEVATLTGRRPIETLRAGDRVLTWSTTTGSLGIQPILTAYHNPPSPTLRLEFEEAAIVTTPWHRFWVSGKGWVVARDLKAGDYVRTLEKSAKIESITPEKTQLVFNLEVAEDHDFLVGRQGALVHDNSVIATVSVPFDGIPSAPVIAQGR